MSSTLTTDSSTFNNDLYFWTTEINSSGTLNVECGMPNHYCLWAARHHNDKNVLILWWFILSKCNKTVQRTDEYPWLIQDSMSVLTRLYWNYVQRIIHTYALTLLKVLKDISFHPVSTSEYSIWDLPKVLCKSDYVPPEVLYGCKLKKKTPNEPLSYYELSFMENITYNV